VKGKKMTADEARMTTEKMVDELLLYTVQFIDEQIRATALVHHVGRRRRGGLA